MRKMGSKLAAVILTVSLALTGIGCGNGGAENRPSTEKVENSSPQGNSVQENTAGTVADSASSGDEIKDLVITKLSTRELETFNILYCQTSEGFENLTNLVDGLVEADNQGRVVPAIAEEWGTDDGGLTWRFKLRDGVKWVDMNGKEKADCTAEDFATGLEWILNYHKNNSFNTSMPRELIKGATEYYEYTKSLSEEEARTMDKSKFFEMVGIQIPDANTIIYTCTEAKPYFYTVATYACLYPAPQALIDELGVEGFLSMNNENMWYNGCYTMTSYIQGNEKIFTKNPLYWDKECKLFDTVTFKMVESNDVAFQMYQAGDIDYVDLTESNLKNIYENPNNEYHNQLVEKRPVKYSYQFHLNYDKRNEDGTPDTNWNTAIANKAFRLAWYYGLDLTEYYKRTNAINPLKCENNFYTMRGLLYTSDGRDYTELVREKLGLGEYNGETMVRLNKEKAETYKKQAIEELTAQGVTFPVELDHYISASSQTALDSAAVLRQAFINSFGEDFIKVNIKTYVSSITKEVRTPRLHSISMNGWGADYGDPQNYLGQETYGEDNAIYSVEHSYINDATNEELIHDYKVYTDMVKAADAIHDDMDKRYEAFAEAEAFMIQNALVIPCNYGISWCLSHINLYSQIHAAYGIQNEKMKNWETSTVAYTTEQFEAFEASLREKSEN